MKKKANMVFSVSSLLTFCALAIAATVSPISAKAATPANNGKFYSDFQTYEDFLRAGRKTNEEIVGEGVTLLKNTNNMLPLEGVKRVSIFGKNSVDPYYHGWGAGAAQSTLTPVTIYEGLEQAGFECNYSLKSFYENNERSGSSHTIGVMIGEAPVAKYDDAVMRSLDAYKDAAIVVISRSVNEGKDAIRTFAHDQEEDPEESIEKDRHYLELSKNEKDMLKMIKDQGFEKIVVLINSANAFEVGDLVDDDGIGGLLWISSPGYDGFKAISKILNGEINPSGHLVDTWYRDFTKDPTWQNFGDNSQTSVDGKTANYQYIDEETGKPFTGIQYKEYVAYEEGIYVGYKYYETYYADLLVSEGKAAADAWYNEQVIFPFGFGLSYSKYTVTNVVPSKAVGADMRNFSTGSISFDVTVKNTGSVAGKDVVEIYNDLPYIDGGVEKAAKNLAGFAKTKLLQPGESDTVTISIDVQDLASYDFEDKNNNGHKGYELDAGNYNFYISSDAHTEHDATTDTVYQYVVSEGDAIYYATDKVTGKEVKNRFDSVQDPVTKEVGHNSYNSLPDPDGSVKMTRMTRASANHLVMPQAPTKEDSTISRTGSLYKKLTTDYNIADLQESDFQYRSKESAKVTQDGKTVQFTQQVDGQRDIKIKFKDMIGVDSDDIKWEEFMNQLTYAEMVTLVSQGRKMTAAIESVGMDLAWIDNGPTCLNQVDYGSANILAATWNLELAERMGRMIGDEALWINMNGWYGPSMDIHRSPFGGRNNEYYAEDGLLSGLMAVREIVGAQKKGLYAQAKHFVLNEQETARAGIATYVDEQSLRELYFKPFQMAIENGGCLGIMTAMNKVGDVASFGNYAICEEILREEWDFNGYVITDSGQTGVDPTQKNNSYPESAQYVNLWQQQLSGNDLALVNVSSALFKYYGIWDATNNTAYYEDANGAKVDMTSFWLRMRESAKRIIFTNAQSNLTKNGLTVSLFNGQESLAVGCDVEFYKDLSLDGDCGTKDVRYYLSKGNLPEGVTLSSAGMLSGTARETGEYDFEVTMQGDSWNSSTKKFHLSVETSSKLNGLDNLVVGTAVSNASVSTDYIFENYQRIGPIKAGIQLWWITLNYHFEIVDGELPTGLTMAEDGTITGTPTAAGEFTFTVNIAASEEASALKQYNTAVTPDYLTTFTIVVKEPGSGEQEDPLKDVNDAITDLTGKIDTLTSSINDLTTQNNTLETKNNELEAKVAELEANANNGVGCGGSIIASSALISLLAVAGVVLLSKKSKEDK